MKTKGQVALAVGAGYMLGRTHRMKMALMLAAAGATGRFPGGPRDLLERGTKMLASSPEFAKISDSVREELVSAAKAAAVTAASQRINSLNNRLLSSGGEVVGDVGDTVDDTASGVGNSVASSAGSENSVASDAAGPRTRSTTKPKSRKSRTNSTPTRTTSTRNPTRKMPQTRKMPPTRNPRPHASAPPRVDGLPVTAALGRPADRGARNPTRMTKRPLPGSERHGPRPRLILRPSGAADGEHDDERREETTRGRTG